MYRVEGRHLEILEHLLKGYSMVSNTGWPLCTDVRKCTDMYGFP